MITVFLWRIGIMQWGYCALHHDTGRRFYPTQKEGARRGCGNAPCPLCAPYGIGWNKPCGLLYQPLFARNDIDTLLQGSLMLTCEVQYLSGGATRGD